jgi:multidrug efflux pump
VSSGQAIAIMDAVAKRELRQGMGFEWTELALQELLTGNTAVFVFILGALLVFMVWRASTRAGRCRCRSS